MRLLVNAARAAAMGAAMAIAASAAGAPIPYTQLKAMEHPKPKHHKPVAHPSTTGPTPAAAPAIKPAPTPVSRPNSPPPLPPAPRPIAPVAVAPTVQARPRPVVAAVPQPAPTPTPPAVTGPRLAPGAPIPPAELEALVDGAVRQAMAEDHIAGVTVAVVQNGQVLLKKGYGFAGPGRRVDPDATLFRLGSISKTFTWIAVMKEVEAGRMRLAAPVNLFLPEDLQVKDQGFKRPIQIRDLMTHTAGFEDRTLGQLFEENPNRIRPLADYLHQERPRRVREAGELPVYSNYGAGLAGAAVGYVEGRPFQDVIDAQIIRPLGLAHTTFREPYPARAELPAPMPAGLAQALSTGYRWTGAALEPQRFVYATQIAPAASASSTAADMARYMLAITGGGQLDGTTLYGPASAHGFQTTLQASAPGMSGWDDGFMEFALPGGFRGQGHDGDVLWFKSSMVTVPALNLGVFVAANTDTGQSLVTQLPKDIVGRFYGPPAPPPLTGSPALAADRAIYAGTYLDDRRPYSGLEKFVFMLIGQLRVQVTDDGRLLTAGRERSMAWVRDGAGLFQQVDGPATSAFQIKGGRAVRWYAPSGATAFDRVGLLQQLPVLGLAALLTALASIATVVGLFTRDRRDIRQSPNQIRASLLQTTIAVLWLIAIAAFVAWAAGSGNLANVIYHWPGAWLMIGSACALVAALLTVGAIVLVPAVWRGGRRVDSWSIGRKFRWTLSTLIFAGFSVVLALWGALEPWSG